MMSLSAETLQTLLILWIFTWLAIALMAMRLIMRKVRGRKLDISDKLTILCIICLLARCGIIHVVLIWGSNNISQTFRASHVFTPREIYQREIGSKLTLVNRTIYNSYIWLQKCVVMILYRRVLFGLPWTDLVMNLYWAILGATYVAIQVATFTDCRPLYLYWQVEPDPGTCSQALGQLIILGALNIFTDILLIVLPMPSLLGIRKSLKEKFRLIPLFSLGVFLVLITVVRLPINFSHGLQQVNRTTWASTEALVAAIVANVPTLYTLRKRAPAPTHSSAVTASVTRTAKRRAGWSHVDSDIDSPGREGITVTQTVELEEHNVKDDAATSQGALKDEETWDTKARNMRRHESVILRDRWKTPAGNSEEDLVAL